MGPITGIARVSQGRTFTFPARTTQPLGRSLPRSRPKTADCAALTISNTFALMLAYATRPFTTPLRLQKHADSQNDCDVFDLVKYPG